MEEEVKGAGGRKTNEAQYEERMVEVYPNSSSTSRSTACSMDSLLSNPPPAVSK
jgi:hypothetical protein